MGNIALYTGKVYLPCPHCSKLIKVALNEKIEVCPYCKEKLNMF
jgi:uncharacterized CHY-type Zn-finger protein